VDETFERFLKKPARMGAKFKISPACNRSNPSSRRTGGDGPSRLNNSDEIIPELVAAGLDGVECFTPSIPRLSASAMCNWPTAPFALVTGGSDAMA
jgi:hypothetical protein